jgi:hypothetical protein
MRIKQASRVLCAQLGEEAAAAGISGDQLQAALELAAQVPLRAVAFADADAEEPASAKVRLMQSCCSPPKVVKGMLSQVLEASTAWQ